MPSLWWKATSFLKTMIGGRHKGDELARIVGLRIAVCNDCEYSRLHTYVDDTLTERSSMFCTECGCGTRPIAELSHKLGYKKVSCPKNKWDTLEDTGDGLSPKDATTQVNQEDHVMRMRDPKYRAAMDKRQQDWAEKHPEGAVNAAVPKGWGAEETPLKGLTGQDLKGLVPDKILQQTMQRADALKETTDGGLQVDRDIGEP